jgi:uncharacterized protein (DUF58 family)
VLPPDKLLHRLDLAIRHRLEGHVVGETLAVGTRGGVELDRVRPWTPGDDWRFLEPSATARTGEPHVRVPVAERRVTVWLGVDVSSSMAFGTRNWEKGDLACSVAAAIGLLGLYQSARVGGLPLGDGTEAPIPPRAGKPALVATIEQLTPKREGLAGDFGECLHRMARLTRVRSVVCVLSDFRADPASWAAPLTRLAHKNDVICVEVRDPREDDIPDVGVATFVDPETGRRFNVDTGSAKLRERFAEKARERRGAAHHTISTSGADLFTISTADDWLDVLVRHLEHRRRRRWTSAIR